MRIQRTWYLLLALGIASGASAALSDCGGCHETQRAAWARSLHAHSADDRLYRAMRSWARKDAGETVASLCENCHTIAILGSTKRTSSVECTVCHQGVATAPGPKGWKVDPNRPVAAARTAGAPHPLILERGLASGTTCRPCHHVLHNALNIPLCTTGPEAASRDAAPSCTRCHMREADHAVPGTSPAMLARAAAVAIDIRSGTIRVSVINRGAGHSLPTGSALRRIVLDVQVLDRKNRRLASHRKVFARTYADGEGHHPVPPWRATQVHSDTRLGPRETRTVTIPRPPAAAKIVAVLTYHRAPEKIIRRLGLVEDSSFRPVRMVRIERAIPSRPGRGR